MSVFINLYQGRVINSWQAKVLTVCERILKNDFWLAFSQIVGLLMVSGLLWLCYAFGYALLLYFLVLPTFCFVEVSFRLWRKRKELSPSLAFKQAFFKRHALALSEKDIDLIDRLCLNQPNSPVFEELARIHQARKLGLKPNEDDEYILRRLLDAEQASCPLTVLKQAQLPFNPQDERTA